MSVVALATPADVISVLKDHGFDDLSDNQFLTLMNEVQFELCAIEPWPFLEVQITPGASIGNPSISTVTNITAVLSFVNTDVGYALIPERWDVINKNYPNYLTQRAAPQYYYFKGEGLFVYPVPDADYNYIMGIQIMPTQLNTVGDSFTWPTRHLWVLVYGCLVRLFEEEDDANMAGYFQTKMDARLSRCREDLWKRQYDRFDRIYDVMDDTWL